MASRVTFYKPLTDPDVVLAVAGFDQIQGAGFTLLGGSTMTQQQSLVLQGRSTPAVDGIRYRIQHARPNEIVFSTTLVGSTSISTGRLEVLEDMIATCRGRLATMTLNIAAIKRQDHTPFGVIIKGADAMGRGGRMVHASNTNANNDLSLTVRFTVEPV